MNETYETLLNITSTFEKSKYFPCCEEEAQEYDAICAVLEIIEDYF